jgi:hypothetical protein
MRFGDRLHDREAQSGSFARRRSVDAKAAERLHQLADLNLRNGVAAVLDCEVDAIICRDRGQANPAVGLVVLDGVVDDVGDHTRKQRSAAVDLRISAELPRHIQSHPGHSVRAALDRGLCQVAK